jgi:HAD superfamily hydrolase (TIGR01459 family)
MFSKYDYFLIDLWGVVHDGLELYPGVIEALRALNAANKKIIFISNAPRRAEVVQAILAKFRIIPGMYEAVITSGEVAYLELKTNPDLYSDRWMEKRYFYLGPDKDANVLMGLGMQRIGDPLKAAFICCTGFEEDNQTAKDILPLLQRIAAAKVPLLCLNPDMLVVRQSKNAEPPEKILCAGEIAKAHIGLGGKVHYFGKPYARIYDHSIKILERSEGKPIDKSKILAIGDGIETDIKGAAAYGIDSLFITGGILAAQLATQLAGELKAGAGAGGLASPSNLPPSILAKILDKVFSSYKVTPTYTLSGLGEINESS